MNRFALAAALDLVRKGANEAVAAGELPEFLAGIERVRVEAVLSAAARAADCAAAAVPLSRPALTMPDRILTPQETAQRLARSVWWVYRHQHTLPRVRFPGSARYGFSERAIGKFIADRTDAPIASVRPYG